MRKVAFLVGNDTFPRDPSIPPLRFAQNDASEFGEILADKETCGFETKLYLNKSSQEVLADLEKTSGDLEPGDTILFYYAGHGRPRRDGQLCLLARDTTIASLGTTSIRAHDVLAYLRESFARRRVLILDCCQSGAIGRAFSQFRGNDVESSLAGLADSFGCYILTASTAIQLAEEREAEGHGIFTKALIDCLREPQKTSITVADLYSFADRRLKISGNQKPKQWALDVEGSPIEIGNFRQRLARLRQHELEHLISTARDKLRPYIKLGELSEEQVESIVSDLECDEARLLPYKRPFRQGVIRFLKGEAKFFEVLGTGHILRPEPAPKPPESEVTPPLTPPETPVVDAPLTLSEPPAIDQLVTPPEPAVVDQLVTTPEPAEADEPVLRSEPLVVYQPVTPPQPAEIGQTIAPAEPTDADRPVPPEPPVPGPRVPPSAPKVLHGFYIFMLVAFPIGAILISSSEPFSYFSAFVPGSSEWNRLHERHEFTNGGSGESVTASPAEKALSVPAEPSTKSVPSEPSFISVPPPPPPRRPISRPQGPKYVRPKPTSRSCMARRARSSARSANAWDLGSIVLLVLVMPSYFHHDHFYC